MPGTVLRELPGILGNSLAGPDLASGPIEQFEVLINGEISQQRGSGHDRGLVRLAALRFT